jgi:hypothetical protein
MRFKFWKSKSKAPKAGKELVKEPGEMQRMEDPNAYSVRIEGA